MEIIEELVRIEKRASEVLGEVEQSRKHLRKKIEAELESIKAKCEMECDKTIAANYEQATIEAEKRVSQIQSRTKKILDDINSEYSRCIRGWEDEFFDRITG